jgi:hypothetical protein
MSREQFNESWLAEMPERIGATELIDMLEYNIKDLIKNGVKPEQVGPLQKIELSTVVYYWQTDRDGNIIIAVEFGKKPNTLVVHAVGKRGQSGNPPFASDLYIAVLNDRKGANNAISLSSDDTMSDKGFDIWKRLLQSGHSISMYDKSAPGQTHVRINSVDELASFFKDDDRDFRRYQYILSEGDGMEIRAQFLTRRTRELAGLL